MTIMSLRLSRLAPLTVLTRNLRRNFLCGHVSIVCLTCLYVCIVYNIMHVVVKKILHNRSMSLQNLFFLIFTFIKKSCDKTFIYFMCLSEIFCKSPPINFRLPDCSGHRKWVLVIIILKAPTRIDLRSHVMWETFKRIRYLHFDPSQAINYQCMLYVKYNH